MESIEVKRAEAIHQDLLVAGKNDNTQIEENQQGTCTGDITQGNVEADEFGNFMPEVGVMMTYPM